MRNLRNLSVFFALVLIVSACSSGGPAEPGDAVPTTNQDAEGAAHISGDFDRVVEVATAEFAFTPASIEVHAGETVRFEVTNKGVVEHEFRLTNQAEIEEHLAMGHEGMHEEGEGHEHATFMLVPPGETKTLEFTFDADAVVDLFACMLPGHYEAGMVGNLEITG